MKRSSFPITNKTIRDKIFEILDFFEPIGKNDDVLNPFYGSGFTFRTAGTVGARGPLHSTLLRCYNWIKDDTLFSIQKQGIQILTIPKTGTVIQFY